MIEIRANRGSVLLRYEGDEYVQLGEFAAAFHAWARLVTGDAAKRDWLRDRLVDRLSDDSIWHIQPGKIETLVEVDGPEDLFDQGGE